MKNSTDRILTTHTGSLPRSKALSALLVKREQRKAYEANVLKAEIERNLDLVIKRQLESGIDIGNDGETPRVGFSTYTTERMAASAESRAGSRRWMRSSFPDLPTSWRVRSACPTILPRSGTPHRPSASSHTMRRWQKQRRIRCLQGFAQAYRLEVHRRLHDCRHTGHRFNHDVARAQQPGIQERCRVRHGYRE